MPVEHPLRRLGGALRGALLGRAGGLIRRPASGGPIIDKRGRAIAVVTLKVNDADNVNLSIRMDMAFKSLRRLAEACDCLVIRTVPKAPVFVDGLLVGVGPRVLLPLEPGPHDVLVPAGGGVRETVIFPRQRDIDLFPKGAVDTAEAADKEPGSRTTLDLDVPDDIVHAPRVLATWVERKLTVTSRRGSKHRGQLLGFRPPDTLKLRTADRGTVYLSLWDLRLIQRN